MARKLYIAGTDRWRYLECDTLEIEQKLTYQIDTCTFCLRGFAPTEGEEVIIKDGTKRLFGGIVVNVELDHVSSDAGKLLRVWRVDCDDYTAVLDGEIVVEAYENMPADDIFRDVAAKYCPGFTVTGVWTGAPVVEYIPFDYIRPSECFRKLCDYVGWHWQPDCYKDLRFFSVDGLADPAPLILVPGGKFRFGKHRVDTQDLHNQVYVRGGAMLSDPQAVSWLADGVARQWVLPWGPHEMSLTVAGVAKTVGVVNLHEEADFDYMMSFTEKYIRCSKSKPTPVAGSTMTLTARQDIDVITMVEDIASQAAVGMIYKHVITDDSLTTLEAAEAAGLADLRERANPQVRGSFETEVSGWAPGQLVTVSLSDRNVEGQFLVQQVTLSPTVGYPGYWTYRVEYGGRLKGLPDILKALVSAQQQKKELGVTDVIGKLDYQREVMAVTDTATATPRNLPYRCGDPDAICGFVMLDNGGDWVFLGKMPVARADWGVD